MCTVSWRHDGDGYLLFFNRDELRRRGRALPPRPAISRGGIPYLAPVDADAGGTWLAVNAAGTTLGLLNHYAADRAQRDRGLGDGSRHRPERSDGKPRAGLPEDAFRSRGLIIPELIAAGDPDALGSALSAALRRHAYRPFVLLAVFDRPEVGALRHVWDGAALRTDSPIAPPLSSSSFQTDRVLAERRARFPELADASMEEAARRMEAFQRGHLPERGPVSVCMHRPDARTVSLSRIEVGRDRVGFRYGDGPACRARLDDGLTLARRRRRP